MRSTGESAGARGVGRARDAPATSAEPVLTAVAGQGAAPFTSSNRLGRIGMTAPMTAMRPRADRIVPDAAPAGAPTAIGGRPVRIQVTPDGARTLHRSIPTLVNQVRRRLAASPDKPWRDLVVDLSLDLPAEVSVRDTRGRRRHG